MLSSAAFYHKYKLEMKHSLAFRQRSASFFIILSPALRLAL